MADIERDAAIAIELAGQMDDWLTGPGNPETPALDSTAAYDRLYPGWENNPTFAAPPDLVEWCRSARDVLARLAEHVRVTT